MTDGETASLHSTCWIAPGVKRTDISALNAGRAGEHVIFRARVQNSRAQGAKMVFFTFRQEGGKTVQGLLSQKPEKVSKQMVKWAQSVTNESIVLVEGAVQASPEPIKSCSVKDAEILISKVILQECYGVIYAGDLTLTNCLAPHRSTPSRKPRLLCPSCLRMPSDPSPNSRGYGAIDFLT